MKKITLFATILSLLISLQSVSAEVYNKYVSDIDTECTNFGVPLDKLGNKDVNINYIDLTYDDVAKEFAIEVKADKSSGKLARFFHFGVTNGPMPGGEGSMAHIYFDANNPADPKATIYVYNGRGMPMDDIGGMGPDDLCGNNFGSWKKTSRLLDLNEFLATYGISIPAYNATVPPAERITAGITIGADKIYSSSNDTNNVFDEVSVSDLGNDTYVYRLVLKTGQLNAYSPVVFDATACTPQNDCRDYSYQGSKFDEHVGLWFWAAADSTSTYSSNFLGSFNTAAATCAICDQMNFQTKQYPKCTSVSIPSSKIVAGTPIVIDFNVNDPDINDDEDTTISVSYTGLPSASRADPENDEIVTLNAQGNGKATVSWLPEQKDVGIYTIKASFAKDYGLDQLVTVPDKDGCIAQFEITPIEPFCKQGDPTPIGIADSNSAKINILALELDRRIKRNKNSIRVAQGKKKVKYSSAPLDGIDTNQIHHGVIWPIYNAIQATDSHTFAECTNTEYCEGGAQISSISSSVTTFNVNVDEINRVALKRASQFLSVRTKYYKVVKGYGARKAARKAKSEYNSYVTANDGINENYASATTEIDLYVNTYGTTRIKCEGANKID